MSHPIHDAFDSIHAEEALKNSAKRMIRNQKNTSHHRSPLPVLKYSLAFLFFLIFSISIGGYLFYTTPIAAISIDMNPSIELEINSMGRVVSTKTYQTELEEELQSLSLKNLPYQEAVERLFSSEELTSYLTEDSLVSITVVCKNSQKNQEIQQTVSNCVGNHAGEVTCQSATKEEQQAALDAGISFGKYRAFLELQALDPSVTIEQIKNLSMREIRNLIEESSSQNDSDNSQSQNGNGFGQGTGAQSGSGNQYGAGQGTGTQSGSGNQYGAGQGTGTQSGSGNQYGKNPDGKPGQNESCSQ